MKKIWAALSLEKKEIMSIYFYAILSGVIQLSLPVGIQAIVGLVNGAAMVASIYVLIFLVVTGVLVVGILQMNQMRIIEKIQQKLFAKFALLFSEKIPNMDLYYAEKIYLPELVNRFFETVNLQKGISKLLLDIPLASIQILFGLLLLSLYHPIFIVFGLLLVIVLYFILKYTGYQGFQTSLTESKYKYQVVFWIQEMARVIKSFKFSQGTDFNLKNTDESLSGYLKARTQHFIILLFQYRTLVVFKVAITASMLIIGSMLLVNQQLNIGEFIAAEIVIIMVIGAVEKLIGNLDSVYDVLTAADKISKVLEHKTEHGGTITLKDEEAKIQVKLRGISLAFPNNINVLENINLDLETGQMVRICGNEGAGKSTLIKLLSSTFTHFTGSFLINQIPFQNYQLMSIRNKTGVLFAEQELFQGTVLENITMGRTKADIQSIVETLQALQMEDLLGEFEDGFNHKIENAGKQLSNNLRKKLLLLRALSGNPKFVYLDEPWLLQSEETGIPLIKHLQKVSENAIVVVATNMEWTHPYFNHEYNFKGHQLIKNK